MDFIVFISPSSPVIRIHRFPKESGLSGGCLEVVLCGFPRRFGLSGVVLWNSLYQTHTFVYDVAFACYCAHVAAEWLLSAAVCPAWRTLYLSAFDVCCDHGLMQVPRTNRLSFGRCRSCHSSGSFANCWWPNYWDAIIHVSSQPAPSPLNLNVEACAEGVSKKTSPH